MLVVETGDGSGAGGDGDGCDGRRRYEAALAVVGGTAVVVVERVSVVDEGEDDGDFVAAAGCVCNGLGCSAEVLSENEPRRAF